MFFLLERMTYGRRLLFYQIWSLLCKYINTYYITGSARPQKENSNMFIQNNPVLFLLHLDAKTAGEAFSLAGHVSLLISCSYLEILFVWNSWFMRSHVPCVAREQ